MPATAPSPAAHALKALRAYHSEANEDALIERNLSLVKTTVDRMRIYLPTALDIEDLYSVGFTGLVSAARKFDPGQGVPFGAYATLHIRGAVHDELRRMDWTPRSIRDKARKFKDDVAAIDQQLGRPATDEEVRTSLSLSQADYESLLDEIKPASFVPLDGEAYSEESDDISLHDLIADDAQPTGREQLQKKELIEVIVAQLQKLPDIPKKVLALYYFEGMRLAEIAAIFGLTEGRISQIHTQAVLSLRAFIERHERLPEAA
jgi:RNA polymerase sigma factor FliA